MQSVCLLFAGRRGLDDFQMRSSIIRVPEVSQKIKQAQNILDRYNVKSTVDLFAYAQMSNTDFANSPNLRVLIASIVQIGLFERFVKYRGLPKFMIGKINKCSAVDVCSQKISFEEFVTSSDYFYEMTNVKEIDSSKLSGLSLEEYGAIVFENGDYQDFPSNSKDCYALIHELNSESIIHQYIHIGPSFQFRKEELEKNNMSHLAMMNSVDTDPMLSSFWNSAIAI